MAKINVENVTIEGEDDETMEIITNLKRDLNTVDDRLKRLQENGISLKLTVTNDWEVAATLK